MIEVQIKSKKLYEELKSYANYNSDLTQVCSFRNELYELLKEKGLEFDDKTIEKISQETVTPILDITGKNIMKLINAPAEMLYFVGVRSELDPTIPIRCMNEVSLLIKNKLVKPTDKFSNLYNAMSYSNKISDLICSNVKFYGKGKLLDYLDGDLTIRSLNISKCREKILHYKQLKLKVLSPIIEKDKYLEINCIEINENITERTKYILRFYNKNNRLLNSIAFQNNIFSISTSKITEDKLGNFIIYDPIILPKGLDFTEDIMYSPISRAIPIDLYRNALYEFKYRYWVKDQEGNND